MNQSHSIQPGFVGGKAGGWSRFLRLHRGVTVLSGFLCGALLTLAYETLKQLVWPDISIWQSHIVTVGFVGLLVALGVWAALVHERRISELVEQSEAFHRECLENIGEVVLLADEDGRFLFVSPHAETLLGHTREALLNSVGAHRLFDRDPRSTPDYLEKGLVVDRLVTVTDAFGQPRRLLVTARRVTIAGGTRLYTCRAA